MSVIANVTFKFPDGMDVLRIVVLRRDCLEKRNRCCMDTYIDSGAVKQSRKGLQVAYCANGQFYAPNYAVGT